MSEPSTSSPKPAVSGGQLFVLGLVLGLVAGALVSAFVTPLISQPGIPEINNTPTSGKAPSRQTFEERQDAPAPAEGGPKTDPAQNPAEPKSQEQPAPPGSAPGSTAPATPPK